jgi:hypothetical protein
MTIDPPFLGQSFPMTWLFDPRVWARARTDNHPQILYHYTSEIGLRGIVSPQSWDIDHPGLGLAAQLWATDVRYMMDAEELRFGAQRFVERFRAEAADPSTPPQLADAMSRLADVFAESDVLRWNLRCYAACLSDSADLVNLWQGYARSGGYAIGFPWEALAEHTYALHPDATAAGTTPHPVGLRVMGYGVTTADAMANSSITGMHHIHGVEGSFVRSMIEDGSAAGLLYMASIVLSELAGVKHGAFQHEREWRLFALSEPGYLPKTRPSGDETLPYLDIAVNMNDTNGAPADVPPTIARLVVGPGHDQATRIGLARDLLAERGHDPDVVVGYDGPYRG